MDTRYLESLSAILTNYINKQSAEYKYKDIFDEIKLKTENNPNAFREFGRIGS